MKKNPDRLVRGEGVEPSRSFGSRDFKSPASAIPPSSRTKNVYLFGGLVENRTQLEVLTYTITCKIRQSSSTRNPPKESDGPSRIFPATRERFLFFSLIIADRSRRSLFFLARIRTKTAPSLFSPPKKEKTREPEWSSSE